VSSAANFFNCLIISIFFIVPFLTSAFPSYLSSLRWNAGGREKVPAAFCRKAVVSTTEFEVWGDGKQTRSFMLIDDCVEGSIRIMLSDCAIPLNLGKLR
jgi:nucleoside-diphosphate-sugar epimerase